MTSTLEPIHGEGSPSGPLIPAVTNMLDCPTVPTPVATAEQIIFETGCLCGHAEATHEQGPCRCCGRECSRFRPYTAHARALRAQVLEAARSARSCRAQPRHRAPRAMR